MTYQVYNVHVPSEGNPESKLWLVGESPGEDEEIQGRPFIGASGNILRDTLRRYNINPEEVYFTNLSPYRPYGNRFEFLLKSQELSTGVEKLYGDIRRYRPNLIVALGGWSLYYLTGKGPGGAGITRYRGSILKARSECSEVKVIATYHPAATLRQAEYFPIFDFDFERIATERESAAIELPQRRFIIEPNAYALERYVEELSDPNAKVAVDIESVIASTHILCVGFCAKPEEAVCIPYTNTEYVRAIDRILRSNSKKIFHFGTFDRSMLRLNGHEVNNYWWDTIVAQHILAPELPRGLDFLASIYTREPYYKQEGRGEIPSDTKSWSLKSNKESLYIYNCKDVCVTFEIQEAQDKELTGTDREIFDYEMELLEPAWAIMDAGLLVDQERRKKMERACLIKWAKLQTILDGLAGKDVNVNSPKQVKELLYDTLKLPIRRNRKGGITTDEDAVVSLITHVKGHIETLKTDRTRKDWEVKHGILRCIIGIRGIRKTLSSYILAKLSPDGRIRSTVNVSATETGRWSMSKYIDDTGANSQTFPRDSLEIPKDIDTLGDKPIQLLEQLNEDVEDEYSEEGSEED